MSFTCNKWRVTTDESFVATIHTADNQKIKIDLKDDWVVIQKKTVNHPNRP